MSQPFGVDLSNAEFNTPESHSAETAPSGDSAPAGEAFKDEAPVPGNERGANETQVQAQKRELTKEDYEKWLGMEAAAPTAEDKKFSDNFQYDIATLIKDPSQFGKFQQIYPAAYVDKARQIMLANGVSPDAPRNPNQPNTQDRPWTRDPEYQQAMQELNSWKSQQREQRIEAMGTKLDTAFNSLHQKYKFAEPELVNARMMALNSKNISFVDDKGNLHMKAIEQLFKQDHEARKAAFQKHYKQMVDEQKNTNLRAKDMGSGGSLGSVPGIKHKTIKEATKAFLGDIRAAR